jgi:hypothetical protein
MEMTGDPNLPRDITHIQVLSGRKHRFEESRRVSSLWGFGLDENDINYK